MPTEILMPALSPTMEEGKLAKWHVSEGDEVRAGDVIAEIETDKATMEVEAVEDGRLGKILVAEGTEHVKVNTPIALLLSSTARRLPTRAAVSAETRPRRCSQAAAPRRRARRRQASALRSRRGAAAGRGGAGRSANGARRAAPEPEVPPGTADGQA